MTVRRRTPKHPFGTFRGVSRKSIWANSFTCSYCRLDTGKSDDSLGSKHVASRESQNEYFFDHESCYIHMPRDNVYYTFSLGEIFFFQKAEFSRSGARVLLKGNHWEREREKSLLLSLCARNKNAASVHDTASVSPVCLGRRLKRLSTNTTWQMRVWWFTASPGLAADSSSRNDIYWFLIVPLFNAFPTRRRLQAQKIVHIGAWMIL